MKEFHRRDFANRTGLAQAWTVKSADRLFTIGRTAQIHDFLFFCCERLSASMARSLHLSLSVYRSRLAPWTRGESNHGKLSVLRPLGCLYSALMYDGCTTGMQECGQAWGHPG